MARLILFAPSDGRLRLLAVDARPSGLPRGSHACGSTAAEWGGAVRPCGGLDSSHEGDILRGVRARPLRPRPEPAGIAAAEIYGLPLPFWLLPGLTRCAALAASAHPTPGCVSQPDADSCQDDSFPSPLLHGASISFPVSLEQPGICSQGIPLL
ncbi:hypothetical protein SETIT_3G217500v2 [Setaria italica]|uniref:Uncharacterized protein n=1 Tax=Setaria italica TaxID=4555 RepID=A0A368QHE3_SETIT|nr:hypothetical protein SETIT_3G217500v2 [Setaria italica]